MMCGWRCMYLDLMWLRLNCCCVSCDVGFVCVFCVLE